MKAVLAFLLPFTLVGGLLFYSAHQTQAGGIRYCLVSDCIKGQPWATPGECPRGADFDFNGQSREVLYSDGTFACLAGAMGAAPVLDSAGTAHLLDELVPCRDLRTLCPR